MEQAGTGAVPALPIAQVQDTAIWRRGGGKLLIFPGTRVLNYEWYLGTTTLFCKLCKITVMKKVLFSLVIGLSAFASVAQTTANNTLLWRISGKNLSRPSYLFGTIHMLCADDIQLSQNLKNAIQSSDRIYLELDMDNMFEMLSVMGKMKMRNDTTLADLLTATEYEKVKEFFATHRTMLPFSVLEKYKPMLAASTLMQASLECKKQIAMEQLVMKEAKSAGKGIRGLETMAYQMSIFDSIPYQLQAKQLLQYVESYGKQNESREFEELTRAYREQELDKLEALTTKDDMGISNFTEILLYRRNLDWAKKMVEMMSDHSLVVAVGAGHLPGEKGVISLLRKAGYTVDPVSNDMIKKPVARQL